MQQKLTHRLSFWEKDIFVPDFDFAVIGAGIVGLNVALQIKRLQPNAKVAVLERGSLPIGASTRNAGFACIGSMTELLSDLDQMPEDGLWALVEKRYKGLKSMISKLGTEIIDYEHLGGYELFRAQDQPLFEACMGKIDHFNQQIKLISGLKNTFVLADQALAGAGFAQVDHLILNRAEGQLHPGKMMRALLNLCRNEEISLLNGFQVIKIEESEKNVRLLSEWGWSVQAAQLIIATNGFTPQFLPDLDLKPARNQVLITEPVSGLSLKGCYHYEAGYYYFRNVGNRILRGGGRNLDPERETTADFDTTLLIRSSLEKLLTEVILPNQSVKVDQWWSGILGVGSVKSPIVQKHSDRITLAVRMGGMGVAIGTLVGEEAAEIALNK
jgi:glycine/D-amino acid oxidase-like deaminating enzyme